MTHIDSENNPEQEAAARDELVKVYSEAIRFRSDAVVSLVSEDASRQVRLYEDGSGNGVLEVDSKDGQEKWYITSVNGPRERISTSAVDGAYIDKEDSLPGESKHAQFGDTATAEKMTELADLIRNGQPAERATVRQVAEGIGSEPVSEQFIAEIDQLLPSNSDTNMAVIETPGGKVLLARNAQGGVTLASESGEIYSVSPNGNITDTISDPAAILSGEQVGPDAQKVAELTEALQHGSPVELPEDPQEALAYLESLELNPQIDFSRRNGQT